MSRLRFAMVGCGRISSHHLDAFAHLGDDVEVVAVCDLEAERAEVRAQKLEIKELHKELRRKEKALAEAAALLILQKKVHALFAEPEDGKSGSGSA